MKAYIITNLILWGVTFMGSFGMPNMGFVLLLCLGMVGWSIYLLASKKAD